MPESKVDLPSNKPRPGRRHGHGAVEKPKDFKGTLRKLLRYLKPYHF